MSDPTGEIADWDGDGRVSAYDVSQHAATHASNSKLKRLYTARAARQYYQSLLSSGRLGASRAAAVASMMVSYALDEAAAWADKEGIRDYYVDASAGYNGLGWNGMVGVMGGHVRNFRDGVMTDEHSYGGVAIGMPGPSYSIMVGEGAVAPGCRYIEFAAGAVGAGAFGFRSDNDRSAPGISTPWGLTSPPITTIKAVSASPNLRRECPGSTFGSDRSGDGRVHPYCPWGNHHRTC